MAVKYSYDDLGRLDRITDSSDRLIADYTYDAMRRTGLALFNAGTEVAFTAYTYDDANLKFDHMTGLTNSRFSPQTTISRFAYAFDNEGNRLSMSVEGDFSLFTGLHDYEYDKIYQVTEADHPENYPHPDVTFAYDSMGNRVTVFSGQTDSYASNNLNQYSSVNGVSFTYDLNGNLTSDGVQTYYYDCENRLIKAVRNSDGQTLGEYRYDPFGRRARKTVNGQPSTVNYLLDGAQVLEERDGDWTLLRSYVYGTGIDEPLVLISNSESQIYFYCFDSLGSVTEIADSSGNVLEHYRYSPFGAVKIFDSSWSELSESSVGNTCCFTGRNIDRETGLYFYRARMYSAELGRFLQTDPIGYRDEFNELNIYKYCRNNPFNMIDPIGLWPEWVHNDIIDRSDIPTEGKEAAKRGSAYADSKQFQDAAHAYMHAMRNPEQTAAQANAAMNKYINWHMQAYRSFLNAGMVNLAYFQLGMALHPLMDCTSPTHEGFQEWRDDMRIDELVGHTAPELYISNDQMNHTLAIVNDALHSR